MSKFKELQNLWTVTQNYRNYRIVFSQHTAPCIPFLGMVTKDLFALESNFETFVKTQSKLEGDSSQLVNWKKIEQIYSMVDFVRKFQKQCPVEIDEEEGDEGLVTALLKARFKGDKELMILSKKLENRL